MAICARPPNLPPINNPPDSSDVELGQNIGGARGEKRDIVQTMGVVLRLRPKADPLRAVSGEHAVAGRGGGISAAVRPPRIAVAHDC
jgi:hypothetical protein